MPSVESARREGGKGHRRFEREWRDPVRYRLLLGQVDAVSAELRRRLGSTFTLTELAAAYNGAERWSRDAIAASMPADTHWAGTVSLAEDAAFHLYQRGAVDYAP
ncbi:MAG: hypothetical protein ACR2MU_06990 [Gaiellaceae bacterium]